MANKLQVKAKFNSASGSNTKTYTVGATDATDSQLKTFNAKIGSFVSAYSLNSLSKIETTSLDDE